MIELRWLIKKEMQFFDGGSPAGRTDVKVLQSRFVVNAKFDDNEEIDVAWSEWQDIPVADE